jgi:hypothetical protein
VKITVIVHHAGNSAQMSFSSTHTKFPNQGRTNAFLTHANELYAANLRGVHAQLCAQSCPSTVIETEEEYGIREDTIVVQRFCPSRNLVMLEGMEAMFF